MKLLADSGLFNVYICICLFSEYNIFHGGQFIFYIMIQAQKDTT